jgi:transposase
LNVILTGANRHDVTQLLPLVDTMPAIGGKSGPPLRRLSVLIADRAYDSQPHREALKQRGTDTLIARRGRPHGSGLGVLRYVAEQTIALLHRFRRLRTRFDRRSDIHEAFLRIACSLICYRRLRRYF